MGLVDFTFNSTTQLTRIDWTFIQVIVAFAFAYVAGHIVAVFAQLLIETFVVSKLISKPIVLQLGFKKANFFERTIGALVGRYYEALEEKVQAKVREGAQSILSVPKGQKLEPEDILQAGFRKSFSVDGTRVRIDSFLNQYGFCRNISFVALIATLVIGWKSYYAELPYEGFALSSSVIIFVAMFLRFVKFYASFQAEVIRTLIE